MKNKILAELDKTFFGTASDVISFVSSLVPYVDHASDEDLEEVFTEITQKVAREKPRKENFFETNFLNINATLMFLRIEPLSGKKPSLHVTQEKGIIKKIPYSGASKFIGKDYSVCKEIFDILCGWKEPLFPKLFFCSRGTAY